MLFRVFVLLSSAALAGAQTAPAVTPAYRLQKGDTIEIRVFDLPELTQSAVVRPDGQISALLAGNLAAAGMTVVELSSRLAQEYGKRFRNPQVSISVLGFANQIVYVGGEVYQPGAVPLAGGITLSGAIIRAGGFKDSSRPEAVVLMHTVSGGPAAQREVNVEAILKGGAPDIPLEPGDTIFVPKSTMNVYVGGEVAQPGLQIVQGRLTLLSALLKAGGPTKLAGTKSVVLIRDSGQPGKAEMSKISLEAILHDPNADVPLHPFDVIYVPRSTIAKVDQWIDDYLRKTVPMSMNGGFSYLLSSALVQTTP